MATPGGLVDKQELIDAQLDTAHLGRVVNSKDASGAPINTSTNRTGGVNKTLDALEAEYEQSGEDLFNQFETTFNSQFTYKRIGNISDYVGQSLPEADKLNSYQYPDDSDAWYAPVQGQAFPITIPADPTVSGSGWVLTASPNIYRGLWPNTGGSANKGETWQTQTGGTPTGQYFTALQNTTVDPVGDDVNWRSVVSVDSFSRYTDIVYKASGGNSAVGNMIAGLPIVASLGSVVRTEAGTWRIVNTSGILLDSGLYAIPLTGLFASDFSFSKDNNATDNTSAWNDLVSKLDSANAVTVKFNGGEFLCNEMSATDVDIKIKGEGKGKNGTIFINESSGNVFNLTRTSIGNAYRNKLKIIGVAIGRDTLDGVHTASGDHGISITGYNNLEVGDIQINQAGRSGIYIENVYVVNINDIAGGYCGQNNATPPEDEGVVRVNRISTGNSIRFRDSYISNSLKTDGLVINNAQSIKVGSSTFESCRNLLKIGTLGQTSRGVSIDTCYFENPSVRSINLISCYGVLISCAYHNLVGPRSDEVFGCVRLESCDRVEIFGGSWSDPQSVSNPNYKGALELFCGGSMAFNGQVFISATASISKICVEKTGGNRLEFNIRSNRCGVEFESLKGLIKPKSGNGIPNTDLTAWSQSGAISVTLDEFFDGSPMYNIVGDGSSSINLSSSTAMSVGDEINFSGFISEACRLRIRGRRVSDGGFEDIANASKLGDVTGVNVASDYTRRFYVNGIATSDYNLINFIIQPTSSDPVTFAYPQSNLDLVPEDYK